MLVVTNAMFRRLGTLLVCLAMFTIAGGHWAVLRSVAWAGMVQDFAREDGLATAVQKTFSGEYPCAMCKKVAEAQKQEEQKPAAFKADKKAEAFVASASSAIPEPAARKFSYPVNADSRFASRSEQPPVPVPIIIAA